MREFGEIGDDDLGIGADVVLAAQFRHGAWRIAAHHFLEQVDDARAIGEPQHLAYLLAGNPPLAMRDRLVEQRERITHRPFRCTRDKPQRIVLDLDAFRVRDLAQVFHEHVRLDAAQIEPLAARQDQ